MDGEVEVGANDGDDEDSKRSNCNMCVASFDGSSPRDVARWGYVHLASGNAHSPFPLPASEALVGELPQAIALLRCEIRDDAIDDGGEVLSC